MPNYVTDGARTTSTGTPTPTSTRSYDELQTQRRTLTRQEEMLLEIEQNLFADAFGLPIFQHPAITAYNSTYVDGVSNIALSPTVFCNFWDWVAVS